MGTQTGGGIGAQVMRMFGVVYGLLCLVALWMIPASVNGWLGVEPDPLAAVYALLLALPWSMLLHLTESAGPWAAAALLAAGMTTNVWLLWRLQRWLQSKSRGAAGA